jgi:hypothetical protein
MNADNKADSPPPSPPERFFSPRRIWFHLRQYRDIYLFPLVGGVALYFSIRLVNRLTGRAVIDDPGAIIGGMYNIVLILFCIGIWGALQGFLIPDVNENKPAQNWQTHLINVLCSVGIFWLLLFYTFR